MNRILLDTHALLWFHAADPQLSPPARRAIRDPANRVLVSAATYWEIAIKVRTGKYVLSEPFPDFIPHAVRDNGFEILPIEPQHAGVVVGLPMHHKDPFDRMLVAQATVEGVPLVSCDADVGKYGVPLIW